MELSYQAESTIETQKVVQLLPNGKIKNLPLASSDVSPTPAVSLGVRSANADLTSGVKLDDTHYLFSTMEYTTVTTDRYYWFVIAEKKATGNFVVKKTMKSPFFCPSAHNTRFLKIGDRKVLMMFVNGASNPVSRLSVVTLDINETFDDITAGTPLIFTSTNGQGLNLVASDLILVKNGAAKEVYACCVYATTHFFTRDKTTGELVFQQSYLLENTNYTTLANALVCGSDTRVLQTCFNRYIGSADQAHILSAYVYDLTYDGDDNITARAVTSFQASPTVSYSTSSQTVTHRNFVVKGNEIYWDTDITASGNYLAYVEGKAILDPIAKTIKTVWNNTRSIGSTLYLPRYGEVYDMDNHAKFSFSMITAANGGGTDMFASSFDINGKSDAPEDKKIAHINNPEGTTVLGNVFSIDGECFAAFYDQTNNNKLTIANIELKAQKAIPIGVARSQTTVTLNGACGGFAGLNPGARYYFDALGAIGTDPASGTYLGTAISPTVLFIDKMLF